MAKLKPIQLFRASQKALRNREILAESASRPTFERGELIRYLSAVTLFPLIRASANLRFGRNKPPHDTLAIGSRKRPKLHSVVTGEVPFDDLEYELVKETWSFFDFRMALAYYGRFAQHIGPIVTLLFKRSLWTSAHYAICLLEWSYLASILQRYPQIERVHCGYYIDRKAFALSLIRAETGIHCVGVQHGAFNIFPTLHRAPVDEVLLIYPFSEPFAQDFFALPADGKVRIAPDEFELGWSEHASTRPFVVFGASADSTDLNRAIITALDEAVPPDLEVLIKLHPRDTREDYLDLTQGRIGFIDKNAKNAAAYVGQLSSVIAEAWTMRIPVAIMRGSGARGSDFQKMLNDDVCQDVPHLKAAVATMLRSFNR